MNNIKNEKKKNEKVGDKLAIRRLISNVRYIIRFAMEVDRKIVFVVYTSFISYFVIFGVYETLFLKYFIEILQNKSINLRATIVYILVGIGIMTLGQIIEIGCENWARARFVRVTGKVQSKFIEKTANIDLICYDNKEYFDDFVIAASQAEEMMLNGILSTAELFGQATGILTLGDVAAMNNGQNSVRNYLDGLNYSMVNFQRVGQFAERFRRFIDYEIKIENKVGIKEVPKSREVLEIKNMSFRYEGADRDTLKNITMTLHPGEKVAIVGENGAGKTTFIKLLMRLYDVTEGSISYGGEDIRSYGTKEYRDIIGAVFQDYQIYGATLAENVLMGTYEEKDREKVIEALRLADFEKKLSRLPEGIETNLTKEFRDDGTMLSGGEAQKVAISRMFAKSGKQLSIAILDEPSSALDPLAEYTLNKNMIENAKEATIIFISHRLSTTREADRIYMFEGGEIIEQGTHEELIKEKGEYARMFEKQAHYYQDELA